MENEIKEKAIEIFENLLVYDWNEKTGFEENSKETIKKCNYMLDEIISLYGDKTYGEIAFWIGVKDYIKTL